MNKRRNLIIAGIILAILIAYYFSAPYIGYAIYSRKLKNNSNYSAEKDGIKKTYLKVFKNPNDVEALKSLALIQYNYEDYGSAEENYKKLQGLTPDDPSLTLNLIDVYRQQKKYQEAEILAKQVIEKDPKKQDGYNLLLGLYQFNMQDKQAEIPNVTQEAYKNTGDAQFLVVEVGYYERQQDFKKAAEALGKWLAVNKNNPGRNIMESWYNDLQSKVR